MDTNRHTTSTDTLIAGLEDEVIRTLALQGEPQHFPRHARIIREGERGDSLFIVLTGRIKVFVSDEEDREMILDTYGPGEYVGEMSLDGQPRSASVTALEPTLCSVVRREPLLRSLGANPDLAMKLIATLIHRARVATDMVRDLALRDVYGRVVRLLIHLARESDGRWMVPDRMTQQDVADRVGASRDMVSRIFKDLQAGGYISVVDRLITIQRRPPARW